MTRIPLYCERCSTLRAVEDWRQTSPQILTIALSPCGHEQERTAREEWSRVPPTGAGRGARVTSLDAWRRESQRRCEPAARARRRTASR